MMLINFFREFFNIVALSGIIILSRQVSPFWQAVIGVTLVILGLLLGGK